MLRSGAGPTESGSHLLSISAQPEHFMIHQECLTDSDGIWKVIRLNKLKQGHALSEGDTLRLGRVKFKVRHISQTSEPFPILIGGSKTLAENNEVEACRICLSSTQTAEDPLVTPCSCAGSMGFVHVLCLREWLKSKMMTRQSHKASSYYWKEIACELCKEELPSSVEVSGRTFQLVNITYPS